MSGNILVVDDEQDIADLLTDYLQNEGFAVYTFYTAQEALAALEGQAMDLAILDVMLPDMDGFALCRQIRRQAMFPIIMLTAKDDELDKITGLAVGADDYVTKPFRPLELLARVKAQLRRFRQYDQAQPQPEPQAVLTYKKLSLNTQTYECTLDGEIVALTPTEFAILRILLERQGAAVPLEELFHAVWQDEYYSKSSSTITVHIRHLREKLQDTAETPKFIKTIWGVGYKI